MYCEFISCTVSCLILLLLSKSSHCDNRVFFADIQSRAGESILIGHIDLAYVSSELFHIYIYTCIYIMY